MGAGASTILKEVSSSSEEQLASTIKEIPDDVWAKLVAARAADISTPRATNPPAPEKEGETIASQPPKEAAKTDPSKEDGMDAWAKATLEAHNTLRAKHGAPPLEWSKECFEFATKQAAKMEKANALDHDNLDGPSGKHGQNCFGGTGKEWTAMDAVKSWYDELTSPGYDFAKPGFSGGTGHFTQVVWKETRFVGMAKSANGNFIAANYLPGGNMQGQFEKNVFPEGTEMQARDPEPKLGTTEATQWSDDVMLALAGCPFKDDMTPKAKEAFAAGHTVIIEREKTKIKFTIKMKDGSSSTMGGGWS